MRAATPEAAEELHYACMESRPAAFLSRSVSESLVSPPLIDRGYCWRHQSCDSPLVILR